VADSPEPNNVTSLELYRQGARLESKIDRVDDKLDGHGEQLAAHEVRIGALERGHQNLRDEHTQERHQRAGWSWGVIAAVAGGGTGGALGVVVLIIQIAAHH
jgi:hypothetical protein